MKLATYLYTPPVSRYMAAILSGTLFVYTSDYQRQCNIMRFHATYELLQLFRVTCR